MIKIKLILISLFSQIFLFVNSNFLQRNLQEKLFLPYTEQSYFQVDVTIGELEIKKSLAIDLSETYTWIEDYSCENPRLLQEQPTATESQTQAATATSTSSKSTESSTSPSSKSNTCVNKHNEIKVETIRGEIKGNEITEKIKLSTFNVAKEFNLITVNNVESDIYFGELYSNIQGVLGLSYLPVNGHRFNFLNGLQQSGSINKKVFSLGKNNFLIGDYPAEAKQFKENFHTCNITVNEGLPEELMDSWICDLTHFSVKETNSLSDAVEIQGRIIIDSTISKIIAPISFLGIIKAHYFDLYYADNNCTVVDSEGYSYIVCDKKIENPPNINFIVEGYGLVIPGNELFVEEIRVDGLPARQVFTISFSDLKHNVWRFGKILLDEYMLVFDTDKKVLGFYGDNKINLKAEWDEWWNSGDNFTSQEHMKYLVIASICLGVALLLVIICLVFQSLKNRNGEKSSLIEENEMVERS